MISSLALGIVLFVIGFVPLLGGPRYEAALCAGLIAPSWAGIFVARRLLARYQVLVMEGEGSVRRSIPLIQSWAWSMSQGLAHGFVILLVALLHGLLGRFCEPLQGFALLLLGPVWGCVAATQAALFVVALAVSVKRRPVKKLWAGLVLLFPLTTALFALLQFYNSPSVFVYDPFAGYFAGPIYDAVEYELPRLLSYRAGSLLTLLGWGLLCSLLELRLSDGRVALAFRGANGWLLSKGASRSWTLLFSGCAFFGSALMVSEGESLGHRASAPWIQAQLGLRTQQGACRVHFDSEVSSASAHRIARECVAYLKQHEAFFELPPTQAVEIYLFKSVSQKRRLMGAGRTNIAKPWRHEIYITDEGYPHPVLGHELAHVVTAAFGQGPLKVSGLLDGLIMDPGRVEGFAEAAALREGSPGSLEQWAAAMKMVKRLPPLTSLFQLGFWGNSATRSYTAAGAFVQFLHQEWGAQVLKDWYGGADLEVLSGKSWEELEELWLQSLDSVTVPAEVLMIAKPRFSRPSLFERPCPHATDRLLSEFVVACPLQEAKAQRLMDEILKLDPHEKALLLAMPECTASAGKRELAIEQVSALLKQEGQFESSEKRKAWDFLGDEYFQQGNFAQAQKSYEEALKLSFDADQARQIEVKLWSLTQEPVVRDSIRRLLIVEQDPTWTPQGILQQWLASGEQTAFAHYLLARTALAAERYDEARAQLGLTEIEALPLSSLKKEARRTELVLTCEKARDEAGMAEVQKALQAYIKQDANSAEVLHMARFAERCVLKDQASLPAEAQAAPSEQKK